MSDLPQTSSPVPAYEHVSSCSEKIASHPGLSEDMTVITADGVSRSPDVPSTQHQKSTGPDADMRSRPACADRRVCEESEKEVVPPATTMVARLGQPRASLRPRSRPFWGLMGLMIGLLALIAVALAVTLGVQSGKSDSTVKATPGVNNASDGNALVIGGALDPAYYSQTGAWNGTGIAIAGANPRNDQSLYAFYQDHGGVIYHTLMTSQGEWHLIGLVNTDSSKALNGTPLSTVAHLLGDRLIWHVFYVDEDYRVRERILTNRTSDGPSPIWTDGPLSGLNLRTWQSPVIGLQACYWGDYYGERPQLAGGVAPGIHIWFASDTTTFQQYSWANNTNAWTYDQSWSGLSGGGGVGCQTWATGPVEYVWFVDTQSRLAMFWRDNNRTAIVSSQHPVGSWTSDRVQKNSALGYTNYMIWQSDDTTIRGANVTWNAENTSVAATSDGVLDVWTLQQGGQDVHAMRGTRLAITAVKTASHGAMMMIFYQARGNDLRISTRDAFNQGGLWQQAAQEPID